jgi:hypothetical protein
LHNLLQGGTVNIIVSKLLVDHEKPPLVMKVLDSSGFVGTRVPESDAITPADSIAAGNMGQRFGHPIFHRVERDGAGDVVFDEEERPKLVYDPLRKQLPMHNKSAHAALQRKVKAYCKGLGTAAEQQQVEQQAEVAEALMDRLQPAATRIAKQYFGEEYTAKKGVILVNDGQTCEDQASHHDTKKSDDAVLVWALARVCLLVWPRSHHAVQAELEMEGMSEEDQRQFTKLSFLPGKIPRWRLWLEAGDIVLMRGMTVHAGAAGFPGLPSPRVHFYIERPTTKKPKEQATHPTAIMWLHSHLESVN